jgi:hypothetical protein
VIHRHSEVPPAVELTVDEWTFHVICAPWTCKSGEMALPLGMPPRFVWQSRWLCQRNPQLENLGPEDCRRCTHWEAGPAV